MNEKQPKALFLLSFVQMCRFFSLFGTRVLLILFLVKTLHFTDSHAYGMTAVFGGIAALMGIFGGMIADKWLGLRRAIFLGGWLLAIGYGCLMLPHGLYPALGLLSLGSALFSTNISALLGTAYEKEDPRRRKGFTIFYIIQNIGALVATVLCGWIGEHFGFTAGFLLSSLGMVAANCALFFGKKHLPESAPVAQESVLLPLAAALLIPILGLAAAHYEALFLPLLPWASGAILAFFAIKLLKDTALDKRQVHKLLIYVAAMVLFGAAEEQISSSLMVFSERMADRALWGFELPSSLIMSVNPVVVIFLGLIVAKMRLKLIVPFLLTSFSFGLLALLCTLFTSISLFSVAGIVALLSLGELVLVPLLSTKASEVAVKGKAGLTMGIIPLAGSLTSLMAGSFSKMVSMETQFNALSAYSAGFGKIALIALCGGVVLQFLAGSRLTQKTGEL